MEADPLTAGEAEEEMQRRRLLESLAVLGAVSAVQGDALSVVRNSFDASLVRGAENTVDDWQEVAHEYGHAYLATPHQLLMPELAADILALKEIIDRNAGAAHLPALYGVGATLASLMASTANSLGLPRESRDWWRSARHYSDVSGDRDLRVWVRGYGSMSALYQGRPYPLVLDQAEATIRLANGRSTPGVMEAMGCKAQVLAEVGAVDEAKATLRQARRIFEKLPASATVDHGSLLTWPEHRLLHAESFVYSANGSAKEATTAHAVALAAYEPSRFTSLAQVRLHEATTLVRGGDISDGIGHAERVLTDLPAVHYRNSVRVIAKRVLVAVPKAEARRPVVNEYRERLAQPILAGV